MRKYELTIVIDAKTSTSKKKTIQSSIEKLLKLFKGDVKKVDEWGEKELADKIKKSTSGIFLHYKLVLDPSITNKLKEKLKLNESILRYLLVREEDK